jgi:[ribosomal protein S5]-alanine N-acetyltransferase
MIELPELSDGVVALRPLRLDDAGPYAAAFESDPHLGRLLGVEHDPDVASVRARAEQAAARAHDGNEVELAIDADGFAGAATLHAFDWRHRRGEVGFWLAPDARGRGLATRAVRLLIGWAFGALGLLRLEMTTTPDNAGAAAVAVRLGFVREGVLRRRNVERGRRVDLVWFGLLEEEWRG